MSFFVPHTQLSSPRDCGQYIVAGPKTFRRACRKLLSNKKKSLPFANFGGNRQNIDNRMRMIWEADPGYRLINRDQSGADAKIVAYLCKHGKYRELFIHGVKPHLYLALKQHPDAWRNRFNREQVDIALKTDIKDLQSLEFWKPLSKLIKDSDGWEAKHRYYYFGKKVGHAGNYGMAANKLVMVILEETQGEIVLSKVEGERWLTEYRIDLFPEIQRDFQFRTIRQAKEKYQLRNLLGFPFNITEEIRDHEINDLLAWIPQSTVAGINERVFCDMQDYIEEHDKDWHLLAETHDSITGQAPEKEAEEYAKVLGDFYSAIELTSPVDGVKFNMGTECQIGYNWSKYDKDKNPRGLQDVKI